MGGNMEPASAKAELVKLLVKWAFRKGFSKEARTRRKTNRIRRKAGLPPEDESMNTQFLQGGLTYLGLAVSAVSFALDKLGVVIAGFDTATVAGVVVGLGVALYGRFRREQR